MAEPPAEYEEWGKDCPPIKYYEEVLVWESETDSDEENGQDLEPKDDDNNENSPAETDTTLYPTAPSTWGEYNREKGYSAAINPVASTSRLTTPTSTFSNKFQTSSRQRGLDPELLRSVQSGLNYSINETARLLQCPILPGGYLPFMAAPAERLNIDHTRYRNMVDPIEQREKKRLEKQAEMERTEQVMRDDIWRRGAARMSVVSRKPPSPVRDLADVESDPEVELEYRRDALAEKEKASKRSFESDHLLLHKLGAPGAEPEVRRSVATLPKRLRHERFEPKSAPKVVSSAMAEVVDIADSTSSEEELLEDLKVPSPTETDSGLEDLAIVRLEQSLQVTGVRERTILAPGSWSAPKSSDGTEYELGIMSHKCMCEESSFLSPASASTVFGQPRPIVCQATFRTEKSELIPCPTPLSTGNMPFYWLPQTEQVGPFCEEHAAVLHAHQICPYCNEFYSPESKKQFVVCRGPNGTDTHLYHRECRSVLRMEPTCPHCLADKLHVLELAFDGNVGSPYLEMHDRDTSGMTDGLAFHTVQLPASWGLDKSQISGYFSPPDFEKFMKTLETHEHAENTPLEGPASAVLAMVRDLLAQKSIATLGELDDEHNSVLHLAVKAGNVGAVLLLTAVVGVDINGRNKTREKDSPLMLAVRHRHASVIHALVKLGARVNAYDGNGHTLLQIAAYSPNFATVLFLLQNGANGDTKGKDGFSFLFSTLPWITEEQLLQLVNWRLDLNVQDPNGWTLPHWCAFLRRSDLIEMFLDLPAIAMRDQWGNTPMHIAVETGSDDFVRTLMPYRPPMAPRNNAGKTIVDLAAEFDQKEKEAGIKPKKRKRMRKLVRRYEGFDEADGKVNNSVPAGEINGDISSGKSFIPVPCYNFIDEERPQPLTYTDIVVKPLIFQFPPRSNGKLQPPCRFPANSTRNCQEDKCHCMRRDKHAERSTYSCQACMAGGSHSYSDYHYCPRFDHGRLTSVDGTVPSLPRPPLTEYRARTVVQRLSRKAATCAPAMAADLEYVVELVRNAHFPERRRRDRSAPNRAVVRVVKKRSPSVPPVREKHIKNRATCRQILRKGTTSRETVIKEMSCEKAPTDENTYHYSRGNPLDLFAELQDFVVDNFIQGALIWFERRHLFARWDLRSVYRDAPKKFDDGWQFSSGPVTKQPDAQLMSDIPYMSECSVLCECGAECPNRITAAPVRTRLASYYVDNVVQWGVMALSRILAGELIAEYSGEIYMQDNGQSLYKTDSYVFGLANIAEFQKNQEKSDPEFDPLLVIDAQVVGNIARYLNHSCNPNAKAIEVLQHGMLYSKIALFAVRTIEPGDPVTLDYGKTWWNSKQDPENRSKPIFCRCGEVNCEWKTLKEQEWEPEVKQGRNRRGGRIHRGICRGRGK